MTQLEQQLTRQLSPVRAPDDLWERIHQQRRPLRVSRSIGPAAQLAVAALVILTTAFAMRSAPNTPQALVAVAVPQLTSCASGSPTLLGARLIRWKGQPIAATTTPPTTLHGACVLCHT